MVLGNGKASRLYQRLVYQDKLADDVSVSQNSGELASQFEVEVDVKKGVDPAKVEAAVADVWKDFLENGPTADELERAKTSYRAYYVRRIEKVGGFGGKATLLASSQVYEGDPGAWRKDLAQMMAATPAQVRDASRKWLSQGDYTLTVSPLAKGEKASTNDVATTGGLGKAPGAPKPVMPKKRDWHVSKSTVDRSTGVPDVSSFPSLEIPYPAARDVEQRHQGRAGRTPRRAAGADADAVRCGLRRRPGPQAGYLQFHHGHARRRYRGSRFDPDRQAA